ncbi:hypothetical protein PHLCEN_2v2575, partial [Hermanssonia centrifuga]
LHYANTRSPSFASVNSELPSARFRSSAPVVRIPFPPQFSLHGSSLVFNKGWIMILAGVMRVVLKLWLGEKSAVSGFGRRKGDTV